MDINNYFLAAPIGRSQEESNAIMMNECMKLAREEVQKEEIAKASVKANPSGSSWYQPGVNFKPDNYDRVFGTQTTTNEDLYFGPRVYVNGPKIHVVRPNPSYQVACVPVPTIDVELQPVIPVAVKVPNQVFFYPY